MERGCRAHGHNDGSNRTGAAGASRTAAGRRTHGVHRAGAVRLQRPRRATSRSSTAPASRAGTATRSSGASRDGAIVGESTPTNPSGNSYIVYRDMEAKDFTLKFEIKVEGDGGSGIQYRSQTGLPWLANIPPAVTANVGPVNLELDDDGSAGRLLAEPRLHRTVLLREHADADSRVARPGGGRLRRDAARR